MSEKITRREFVQGAAALAPLAFAPITLPQSTTKAAGGDRFDIVIAGAGHNSLVTACYLAKAGYRCVVLEGRPQIGGGAKTAELTLRGFHSDTCSCSHSGIQSNPLLRNNELKLGDYGLEYIFPDPVYHYPFPDGSYITRWRDFDRTCEEIAKYSKKDAAAYRRMADEAEAMRRANPEPDPNLPLGFGSQRPAVRPPDPLWQRRKAMSKWAVLHENFEDERTIVSMMAAWPKEITHPFTGMAAYPNRHPESPLPKGGSGMLSVALGRCFEAHGGVILVNKPVVQLIVEGGKCTGVECADGSSFRAAKAVVSTIHIKRLVDMAPRELWGQDFVEGVKTFEGGPGSFNTHYATTEPLKFPVKDGTVSPVHSTTLSSRKRALAWEASLALGAAGLGEVDFEDPVLHMVQPSAADPTRAPAGMHTVRILSDGDMYNLKDGGPARWEEIKERLSAAHLKAVQRLAPNLTDDKILARFIVSPVDTERMNPGMWHGSCHGGTEGPAQAGALRPVPGWAQYRMPIPGLYQTGATTHPGGAITGWPGRNAAWVVLKDLGTSLEEVIGRKTV